MKPQQSFLSRIMSTLNNIWGNTMGKPEPLKVISPKTPDQMAEDQRLLERQNYIRKGATFPEMSPRENAISAEIPQPTPTPIMQQPSPDVSPTPPPVYPTNTPQTDLAGEIRNFLETNIFPITRKFNIPDALAASQWATEGGRSMGNEANNLFGILDPSGSGKLVQYPSIDRNVEDYALTVNNILKNKGIDTSTNAYNVLMGLQTGDRPRYEAHNPNQWDYTQTVMNTPEWRTYFR